MENNHTFSVLLVYRSENKGILLDGNQKARCFWKDQMRSHNRDARIIGENGFSAGIFCKQMN